MKRDDSFFRKEQKRNWLKEQSKRYSGSHYSYGHRGTRDPVKELTDVAECRVRRSNAMDSFDYKNCGECQPKESGRAWSESKKKSSNTWGESKKESTFGKSSWEETSAWRGEKTAKKTSNPWSGEKKTGKNAAAKIIGVLAAIWVIIGLISALFNIAEDFLNDTDINISWSDSYFDSYLDQAKKEQQAVLETAGISSDRSGSLAEELGEYSINNLQSAELAPDQPHPGQTTYLIKTGYMTADVLVDLDENENITGIWAGGYPILENGERKYWVYELRQGADILELMVPDQGTLTPGADSMTVIVQNVSNENCPYASLMVDFYSGEDWVGTARDIEIYDIAPQSQVEVEVPVVEEYIEEGRSVDNYYITQLSLVG